MRAAEAGIDDYLEAATVDEFSRTNRIKTAERHRGFVFLHALIRIQQPIYAANVEAFSFGPILGERGFVCAIFARLDEHRSSPILGAYPVCILQH
ncbi:hypothetical protein ATE69_03585 [Sphingopyxis sp. H071]|nr:hypothetical protein ATE61_03600 [Sphingopyxis sp. H057]KTE54390.1 hypothetical protein ATE64_03605 [Sphingopyxis sp. H073]KTE56712.1 hypothetical protein ATE69_03585 [Sphingopyxis sp. H071]KTE57857.1 hypothetical protein ATE66_17785 [Sphingopyxis sp. H107]KTE68167.1 hypothetical protein ATE65_01995 [Sphingopyxis sp. H100]KTE72034.1 hypothetical protein ATE60_11325 [Sphingopyxis sp. H081]KTE80591.1 hypothetical protein ATE63_11145 [Sphingopyxis sp. H067]